jgi:hypothetical protein
MLVVLLLQIHRIFWHSKWGSIILFIILYYYYYCIIIILWELLYKINGTNIYEKLYYLALLKDIF